MAQSTISFIGIVGRHFTCYALTNRLTQSAAISKTDYSEIQRCPLRRGRMPIFQPVRSGSRSGGNRTWPCARDVQSGYRHRSAMRHLPQSRSAIRRGAVDTTPDHPYGQRSARQNSSSWSRSAPCRRGRYSRRLESGLSIAVVLPTQDSKQGALTAQLQPKREKPRQRYLRFAPPLFGCLAACQIQAML